MAQCVQCGRELPAITVGELTDRCADCRRDQQARSNVPERFPHLRSNYVGSADAGAGHAEEPGRPEVDTNGGEPRFILPPPVVTYGLIAICVLVFVAMVASGVSPTQPNSSQIIRWGAQFGPLTMGGQWWRFISSMFVHIGLMHLALNMWCLWQLGLLAERVFGRALFLSIYLLTGVAGSVASLAVHPVSAGAGASGAIFGIAGALIALLYLGRMRAPQQALKSTLRSLVLFAVINLALGAKIPGIDNAAHVGGLVSGLLVGALLAKFAHREMENAVERRRYIVAAVAVVIVVAAVLVARANAYVVHMYHGQLALASGNADAAITELNDSIRQRPNDPYAHLLLGKAYGRKNDYARAEAEFRRALALNPNFSDARFQLGMTLFIEGRENDAADVFAELQRQDANDPDAYVGLGTIAAARGNYEEALNDFRKAVQLDPDYAAAQYNVGLASLHLGQIDDAIAAFRKAAQLDPTDYDNEYMLAQAYKAKGMTKEADEALARAQALKQH